MFWSSMRSSSESSLFISLSMLLILKTIKIFKKYYQSIVVMWQRMFSMPVIRTVWRCESSSRLHTVRIRLRLHWSQKRHNTTVWTDSRHGSRNRVATFNPTCVSRPLATQGLLVLSLLIVSDVNGTWCTCRVMTGINFYWQIVIFAWSMWTDEDGGSISFGNQELMENILNCARYW
jgi:hypothetical protein